MSNGKQPPEGVSRADRVMGRVSTEAADRPAGNSPGRTTQSWRPPGTRNSGAGDASRSGAPASSAAPDRSAAPGKTSGPSSSPAPGKTAGPGARPAQGSSAGRSGGNGAAVATGKAASAVPGAKPASRNGKAVGAGQVSKPAGRAGAAVSKAAPPARGARAGSPVRPRSQPSTGTASSVTSASQFGAARRTRKARLRLARLDPWSVMKTSFMFSIAAGVMLWVATFAIYGVLETSGLFGAVNAAVSGIVSSPTDPNQFDITQVITLQRVLGAAAVIAALNVVIFTALATLFSFLYNISATVLGGLEVTLAED